MEGKQQIKGSKRRKAQAWAAATILTLAVAGGVASKMDLRSAEEKYSTKDARVYETLINTIHNSQKDGDWYLVDIRSFGSADDATLNITEGDKGYQANLYSTFNYRLHRTVFEPNGTVVADSTGWGERGQTSHNSYKISAANEGELENGIHGMLNQLTPYSRSPQWEQDKDNSLAKIIKDELQELKEQFPPDYNFQVQAVQAKTTYEARTTDGMHNCIVPNWVNRMQNQKPY